MLWCCLLHSLGGVTAGATNVPDVRDIRDATHDADAIHDAVHERWLFDGHSMEGTIASGCGVVRFASNARSIGGELS